MNILKLIKEAHQNAIDKGDYDCPSCEGAGIFPGMEDPDSCLICNETGLDPNKNIGELLMLIFLKLREALEAHGNGRFANLNGIYDLDEYIFGFSTIKYPLFQRYFKANIKDSFEDKIADVFIRLFDLCGYLGIRLDFPETIIKYKNFENLRESLLYLCGLLSNIRIAPKSTFYYYNVFFQCLLGLSQHHNIPIEKHIEAKMAYNKTRSS